MIDVTSDAVTVSDAQRWLNEIAASKEREKKYRDRGDEVLETYSGKKKTPFNILFSNTETLAPALYSAVPRPVVQRRFKDADEQGKAASEAGKRVLEFLLDTNVEGYETFDDGLKAAVLDALLPGRGVTCVKYDADIGELPPPEAVTESPQAPEASPYIKSELVCLDSKLWNRVHFGYARKWSKVPWIAYEEHIDKAEATRLFGEVAEKLKFTDNEENDEKQKTNEEKNKGERKTCLIYQIWDKDRRAIVYVSPQLKDEVLKEEPDPLGLTGFFNCPKPIQFIRKAADLTPTALYDFYEEQAKELNELTRRISNVTRAIKAKGVYDSMLGSDIQKLLEADDNEFVPSDKGASIAAEKGLDNAIWFMPLENLIVVLRELQNAREQCKQTIYEITGIADIMRGQTNASETLGAQEIKEGWGKLRLKNLQKEVQRYARDLLRMMLEIAASKFGEEAWARMTGLPFTASAELEQLQLIAQAAQQAQQPLPPEVEQKLQAPKWPEVLQLLKDDLHRSYRIDIETNSTVEAEATEDQKNIAEFMNAMGQLLNGISPLVVQGILPFQAAQAMMLTICRRFRFGPEMEDYIKAMQPPKPPDDGAKEAEAKVQEAELKVQKAELEKDYVTKSADLTVRETKLQLQEQALGEREQMARDHFGGTLDKTKQEVEKKKQKDNSEQMYQAMQQMSQQFMQFAQQVLQKLEETEKRITAPKKVIRDEQGVPIAVEQAGQVTPLVRSNDGKVIGIA